MGVPTKRTDATRASSLSAFKWNAAKEQALWLVFDAQLSLAAVAQNVGVSSRTLDRWVAHPVFQARLQQMRADLSAALQSTLYVAKESRILALANMAQKARREFEARPWLREVRPTKDGDVTIERFNADAFAAFRGALDDIAKEKGERKTTAELNGEIKHTLKIVYVDDWREKPQVDAPTLMVESVADVDGPDRTDTE